jgi:hypothetical protein
VLPDAFPWMGLLALATAAFTDVTTDLLPAGLLPQLSGSLHVPEARAGLLVSAFAIASALAAIPVTAALRGLPRRAVLAGFALLDAITAISPWYGVSVRLLSPGTRDCVEPAQRKAVSELTGPADGARRGSRRRRPCRLAACTAGWSRCWRGRGAGGRPRWTPLS